MSNIGKRFAEPAVWEKPHFAALDIKQRLFLLYLNNRCDLTGVHQLHFPVDSAYIGFTIDQKFVDSFVKVVNADAERIKPLEGKKLWILNFIRYQQTGQNRDKLSSKAPPHKSIVKKLKDHGLFKQAIEHDPKLFCDFFDDSLGYSEGKTTLGVGLTETPSECSNYPNARVSLDKPKGYSNGTGNSSDKGKSHSNRSDSFNKAESIINAYPKKVDPSDLSIVAIVEDTLKFLADSEVKNPVEYLKKEIAKLDKRTAPDAHTFFESIQNGHEVKF